MWRKGHQINLNPPNLQPQLYTCITVFKCVYTCPCVLIPTALFHILEKHYWMPLHFSSHLCQNLSKGCSAPTLACDDWHVAQSVFAGRPSFWPQCKEAMLFHLAPDNFWTYFYFPTENLLLPLQLTTASILVDWREREGRKKILMSWWLQAVPCLIQLLQSPKFTASCTWTVEILWM